MSESNGVFQLKNGYWGYRFVLKIDGKTIRKKKVFDCNGQRLKTKKQ